MKRSLKILVFLSMLIIAGLLTQIPMYMQLVFPVCFVLTLAIFIGFLCYVKFKLKKKIFVWILAAFLLLPLNTPFAFGNDSGKVDEQSLQELRRYNESKKREICEHVDKMDKEGNTNEKAKSKMYDEKMLEVAQKIIENSTKLNNGATPNPNLDEAYRCAKAYADKAGEIQKSFSQKCSPFTVMIKAYLNRKSCWPCDVTGLVLASIQSVSVSSYEVIRNMALTLLGLMFAFWLAYVTLAFFGKFGFARISEYLTSVLNKAVLVIIIAALLHAPLVNVYQLVISPLVQYAAGIAITVSNISKTEVNRNKNLITTLASVVGGKPKCDYCKKVMDTSVSSGQFLDRGTVNSMLCIICQVYQQVSPMITLGQSIVCYSSAAPKSNANNPTLSPLSAFSIPSFTGLFFGMVYIIIFSLLMIIIGFHLMSSTLRLGFVLCLMPIWMVFFVFKTTRLYAGRAWALLLHALSGLIALSLATGIVMIGFNTILPTKAIIGFILRAMRSSPTELLGSFAGVFDGQDPFGSQSDSGDSWASGLTDKLVDFAIDSIAGSSPQQMIILFSMFAFLSLRLVDKSSEYMERLLGAWICAGNVGAEAMVSGASTGLKAVGSMAKPAGYLVSGAGSFVAGAVASGLASRADKKQNEIRQKEQQERLAQEEAVRTVKNKK